MSGGDLTRGLKGSRRADAAALSILVAFFVVFFGVLLLPDGHYPVSGDSYFYSYPLRVDAWRMIRAGHLPLWTPHLMSGYPLLSMAQMAIGYPLTWGYLFLPGHVAETIYILAPFLLAPAFTYAYARQIGRSRAASVAAGLAFGWGGAMANGLAHNGMLTNAIAWLPLTLVAIERARTRAFAGCLLGATAAYSMSVLNGFGQGFVFVGLVVAAYSVFAGLFPVTNGDEGAVAPRGWERWRPMLVGLGALAFSAGVCAFQIMETLRAVRRSVRSVLTYEIFSEGSYDLWQAFESLSVPLFSATDVTSYVAPLVLALAAAGAWYGVRRDARGRDPRAAFWLFAAVAAFVLMLGGTTPLYRLVYHLPVLSRFRVPSRHTSEWTFSVAVLAAYGFDYVRTLRRGRVGEQRETRQRALRVAVLAALGLCVAFGLWWHHAALDGGATTSGWSVLDEKHYSIWKLGFTLLTLATTALCLTVRDPRWRTRLLVCALVVACFFEPFILFKLWWRYVRKPSEHFSTPAVATRFMQSYPAEQNRVYTRVRLFSDETIVPRRVDAPNVSAVFRVQNVAGYEPLIFSRYSRALGNVALDTTGPQYGFAPDTSVFGERSTVLDLLNTTFVAVLTDTDEPAMKTLVKPGTKPPAPVETERWQPVYNDDNLLIMRNRRAMPRAWLVAEAESVDGETALKRVRGDEGAPAFDPRRTVLLEDAPAEMPQLPGGPPAPGSGARVAEYEPNRIVVETDAPTATVLVVSEIFYPGWEATLDGRPERIRLADFLLRGVAVPAGRHRVEMRYAAPQARAGAGVSALTLAGLAGLAFAARRRRRRADKV